jgi:non-specific serine/threonine protein kinase
MTTARVHLSKADTVSIAAMEARVPTLTAVCALPGIGEGEAKPPVRIPGDGEFDTIAVAVPPMIGAEYLTADVLANLWRDMDVAFDAELAEARLSVQEYLKSSHPAWNLIGRVHFNWVADCQG